jgi:alkaline phosphatase
MFYRIYKGHIGIVSTAFIADATPAALTAHTRDRDQYGAVVDSFIHGIVNYTWTEWNGPDVLFGGGAEQFCNQSGRTYQGLDYYKVFRDAGYATVNSNTTLQAASSKNKTLGIFSTSNMAKWLDRNVYTDNLKGVKSSPTCNGTDALDQPGLKEMTIKAIDILNTRAGDKGWFIMSEAASIDKQMHLLDYDRALGELLELDDTVKASIKHLQKLDALKDTLVIVTADHGHGFDVFGSVDTQYLNNQTDDRQKRRAVGTYGQSGLSQYINTGNLRYADSNFPSNWDPRYTLAQGFGANPDHRENYQVHKNGPRAAATNITGYLANNYFVNPADAVTGFVVNGTLPTSNSQGVHSLTDVPVFAQGPCSEIFGGVYSSIDVFYKMAECLGLSRSLQHTGAGSTSTVKSNSGTSSAGSSKSSSSSKASSSSSSSAATGRPVTQISDGQIQAPTGTGAAATSAKTTPTAASSKPTTSAGTSKVSLASSASSAAATAKTSSKAATTTTTSTSSSLAASAQPYKTNPDNSGKYGPQFGYKQYGPSNPIYAC